MRKICTGCKVEKSYDEFGKVKKAFDGLNQKCKKCCNERAKRCIRSPEAIANSRKTSLEWQKRNREMLNERCKEYYVNNLEHRREYLREYMKDWHKTSKGRVSQKKHSKEFRLSNPEKASAHKKIYRAIKNGKLERPDKCSICEKVCKVQAHHVDYSKPFDIKWLCQACHLYLHQGHKFHRKRLSALAPDNGDTKV